MKKKPNVNPHCPVPGCRTKTPHINDTAVAMLVKIFDDPVHLTVFVRTAMTQLLLSMQDDWKNKRQFAWFCRMRQPEELFYKTLYAIFFASAEERHHMISGEMPNGIVPYYTKVNNELYAAKGKLTETLPGLPPDSVLNTPLEVLHSGAHTAFSALLTGYAFATNPKLEPYVDKMHMKVEINVHRIDWIHRLFLKGHTRHEILQKFKNDLTWRDELAKLKADATVSAQVSG